jgi:hypothetical protein
MAWYRVTQKVIAGVYQGVTTVELDVHINYIITLYTSSDILL